MSRIVHVLFAIGDWLGATPVRAGIFLSVVMVTVVVFG